MTTLRRRTASIAIALAADRLLREPPTKAHPVAWFGSLMGEVERRLWRDRRVSGVAHAATGVLTGVAAGALARSNAAVLTVTIAGSELDRVANEIGAHLRAGDVAAARELLPSLVGRDPEGLDEAAIAAAVVESVAENSVDAVMAPIFWTLVAGAPGAAAYRAVNTLDAMVGHRSERYGQFGWASARLDDVANWVPARAFALLVALASPADASNALTAVRRDARGHPSPNAGVAESAVAGSLAVELGGPLRYGDRAEIRPLLGSGPRPDADTIARAVRLVDRVQLIVGVGAGLTAAASWLRSRR